MFKIANWFCLAVILTLSASNVAIGAEETYNIGHYYVGGEGHWQEVTHVSVWANEIAFQDPSCHNRSVELRIDQSTVEVTPGIYGTTDIKFHKPDGGCIEWKNVRNLKSLPQVYTYKDCRTGKSVVSRRPPVYKFTNHRTGKKVILAGNIVAEEN